MFKQLKPAIILLAAFTLILGLAYPALVMGLAQAFMPHKANGSLIVSSGPSVPTNTT